jgi:hypothetical protein
LRALGFACCTTKHAIYTRQWGKELGGGVYVDDLFVTI